MANFLEAFNITLKHEGGYANNPNDKGGETYQGIARNYWPDWIGWHYLDGILNKSWNAIYAELNGFVADFYYENFWLKFRLEEVKNQDIGNQLYDWFMNSGRAVEQVQKVLNGLGESLAVDNKIGTKTIAAINRINPQILNAKIIEARKNYYETLVNKGLLDSSFLNGLLARAESFKNTVVDSVGKPPPPMGRA